MGITEYLFHGKLRPVSELIITVEKVSKNFNIIIGRGICVFVDRREISNLVFAKCKLLRPGNIKTIQVVNCCLGSFTHTYIIGIGDCSSRWFVFNNLFKQDLPVFEIFGARFDNPCYNKNSKNIKAFHVEMTRRISGIKFAKSYQIIVGNSLANRVSCVQIGTITDIEIIKTTALHLVKI